jgi:hypothetical protein
MFRNESAMLVLLLGLGDFNGSTAPDCKTYLDFAARFEGLLGQDKVVRGRLRSGSGRQAVWVRFAVPWVHVRVPLGEIALGASECEVQQGRRY